MTDKQPPAALAQLRKRLDEIDAEVLELLAKRTRIIAEVAAVKKTEGVAIRDFQREREVLEDRRKRAAARGLAPGPSASRFRRLMLASRDVHRVVVADVGTPLRPEHAAASADVVVISVPIQITTRVIEELAPRVRPDALLMDITSIKQEPLAAMLKHGRCSVVGTHPMFGPGVHTLQGQRFVVCRGRGDAWGAWLEQMLEARGLVVTRASAEEHDRAMALVQVLTHFQTQVLGLALSRCGVPLAHSRKFTSPAYLMELYVAARHFAQDPKLYGPIEMLNPDRQLVTDAFRKAAEELGDILARKDQERFDAMFAEVRAFFGDFAVEATEQSSFLIDRLVERTIG